MTAKPLTTAKLAAALIGVVLVGYGMRVDDPLIRWIGIAFLAGAWMLRFLNRRGDGARDEPE